jgi:hypothetical protein
VRLALVLVDPELVDEVPFSAAVSWSSAEVRLFWACSTPSVAAV